MNELRARVYRCPYTGEPLEIDVHERSGAEIVSGNFVSPSGRRYNIESGIPHLIRPSEEIINERERRELDYYETSSESYDAAMDWLFESFYEVETDVRERMLARLALQEEFRVLEIGCGTCRDSVGIARRLGDRGELFLQDRSSSMLSLGRKRMRQTGPFACPIEYFVGNAAHLPFSDGFFDAVFHFGGLNLFSDKKRVFGEMTRVARLGGHIVAGDEGLAPWLRETTYGRILVNSNSLYGLEAPLDCLPENAVNVALHWFLGNAFYLIDYTVGESPPRLNLDLPIPGARGGTHRTRYYGKLEGVSVETKEIAEQSARREGLSLHEWLDRAVRAAALRDLEK